MYSDFRSAKICAVLRYPLQSSAFLPFYAERIRSRTKRCSSGTTALSLLSILKGSDFRSAKFKRDSSRRWAQISDLKIIKRNVCFTLFRYFSERTPPPWYPLQNARVLEQCARKMFSAPWGALAPFFSLIARGHFFVLAPLEEGRRLKVLRGRVNEE